MQTAGRGQTMEISDHERGLTTFGGDYELGRSVLCNYGSCPVFFFFFSFSYIQVNQGRNEIALHAIQSLIFA